MDEDGQVAIYTNMDTASEDKASEVYFSESITSSCDLQDYLQGSWDCEECLLGDGNVKAFKFIPTSENTMNVYCYANGCYYAFERE